MVKKAGNYVIALLFSLFTFVLSVKRINTNNEYSVGVSKAEAKCCPAGSTHLDANGNCCTSDEYCYI